MFLSLWCVSYPVICLPLALLSEHIAYKLMQIWCMGALTGLRVICNLRYELHGLKHLPHSKESQQRFIIASQHQSTFETLLFQMLFGNPAFILKKQLLYIPVFGWYLWCAKMIYIERSFGVGALKKISKESRKILSTGRVLIIFPEGTRSKPGATSQYKSGIYMIHQENPSIPIVPVALNSGEYWPKGFLIKPGIIHVKFLEPITANMPKDELLSTLSRRIKE